MDGIARELVGAAIVVVGTFGLLLVGAAIVVWVHSACCMAAIGPAGAFTHLVFEVLFYALLSKLRFESQCNDME